LCLTRGLIITTS